MTAIPELRSAGLKSDVGQGSSAARAVYECDWCGKPVRAEVARERLVSAGDGDEEVVVLCAQCEFGTD